MSWITGEPAGSLAAINVAQAALRRGHSRSFLPASSLLQVPELCGQQEPQASPAIPTFHLIRSGSHLPVSVCPMLGASETGMLRCTSAATRSVVQDWPLFPHLY